MRAAAVGAAAGLMLAVAITYVPLLVAGDGYYEATDPLVVFSVVLVPLGAGIGALVASMRGRADEPARGRRPFTVVGFVVLLVVLWQAFATLTGAPGLR